MEMQRLARTKIVLKEQVSELKNEVYIVLTTLYSTLNTVVNLFFEQSSKYADMQLPVTDFNHHTDPIIPIIVKSSAQSSSPILKT